MGSNPYLSTFYLLHVSARPGPLPARIIPVESENLGCYVYHKNNYAFTYVNYANLFTYFPIYIPNYYLLAYLLTYLLTYLLHAAESLLRS